MRAGTPCPLLYANVMLAERFGCLPWELEDAPLDQYRKYLSVLAIEGEVKGLLADLEPDEPLIRM